MSVPALASFAILQFLWVWNDLPASLIFLGQGENTVMPVAMTALLGSRVENWQLPTARAFLTMIVPVTVFPSLQRFFVRPMTASAVKG